MNQRRYALVLGSLAFLFFLRVVGQILVVLALAPFLPPMEAWYSGLMAYPPLLVSQIVILTLQVLISRDLWRGRGFFTRRYPALGHGLHWFSMVYFVVMLLRYVAIMAWYPELHWLIGRVLPARMLEGAIIPIYFHWVLAAYVFVWGRYHTRPRTAFAPVQSCV